MVQFLTRCSIVVGCFALMAFCSELAAAQSEERPQRLIQTAADIAALPASRVNPGVRVGFAPAQSSTNSGYPGSLTQQQTASDVYPYPASNRPSSGVGSQAAFALSQGTSGGRLTNQVSLGSGSSTGNLNASGFNGASNSNFAGSAANSRLPVEQQRSSTLNPVAQARINQAAVDRQRAQQLAVNTNPTALASRPPCLLYTSPSPRDATLSRMPSSA